MERTMALLTLAFALILVFSFSTGYTMAYQFWLQHGFPPYHWPGTPTISLGYRSYTTWSPNCDNAASSWNAVQQKISLYKTSDPFFVPINVRDANDPSAPHGWCYIGGFILFHHYLYADIWYNNYWGNYYGWNGGGTLNANIRKGLFAHEFGHAIGLNEENLIYPYPLMQYDTFLRNSANVFVPQQDDITGINTLYNGVNNPWP